MLIGIVMVVWKMLELAVPSFLMAVLSSVQLAPRASTPTAGR